MVLYNSLTAVTRPERAARAVPPCLPESDGMRVTWKRRGTRRAVAGAGLHRRRGGHGARRGAPADGPVALPFPPAASAAPWTGRRGAPAARPGLQRKSAGRAPTLAPRAAARTHEFLERWLTALRSAGDHDPRRLAMLAALAPAGAKTPYYMYAPTPKPTPKPTPSPTRGRPIGPTATPTPEPTPKPTTPPPTATPGPYADERPDGDPIMASRHLCPRRSRLASRPLYPVTPPQRLPRARPTGTPTASPSYVPTAVPSPPPSKPPDPGIAARTLLDAVTLRDALGDAHGRAELRAHWRADVIAVEDASSAPKHAVAAPSNNPRAVPVSSPTYIPTSVPTLPPNSKQTPMPSCIADAAARQLRAGRPTASTPAPTFVPTKVPVSRPTYVPTPRRSPPATSRR